MNLDIDLMVTKPTSIFSANITHNLTEMADAAGLYECLWRPEDVGVEIAGDLIEPLRKGLARLEKNPAKYKRYNPINGFGTYESLVRIVTRYLAVCEESPEAIIEVCR